MYIGAQITIHERNLKITTKEFPSDQKSSLKQMHQSKHKPCNIVLNSDWNQLSRSTNVQKLFSLHSQLTKKKKWNTWTWELSQLNWIHVPSYHKIWWCAQVLWSYSLVTNNRIIDSNNILKSYLDSYKIFDSKLFTQTQNSLCMNMHTSNRNQTVSSIS